MILIKIHKTLNGDIIAMCDKDILGETFEDKNLRITASEQFYNGNELKNKEELLKVLKNCSSLNILGKESVEFAIKNKIIGKENILKIKNIPHAIKIIT